MPKKISASLLFFMLFLLLVHLLYFPTWNAGFVTDFTGLQERLEGKPVSDAWRCFGFPALEQVLHFFLYLFYRAFHATPLPWYLLFTTLHALNGWLLFRWSEKMFRQSGISSARFVALAGSLFFMLSPYQSEVVVWRVCLNFLLSSFLILSVLWWITNWLESSRTRHLFLAHSLFVIALFTYELTLALPLMGLLWALWLLIRGSREKARMLATRIILPQWSGVAAYFLLNKLILGQWVGHYGASVHLRFHADEMLANAIKFVVKLTAFTRYWKHPWKEDVFSAISRPEIWLTVTVLAGILILAIALFPHRLKSKGRTALLFLSFFLAALSPILNLYFNYLLHIENDRYGYLASLFFFPVLALVFSLFPKVIRVGLVSAYLGVSGWLLYQTNQDWKAATQVYDGLLENFRWYDAPEIFVLNLPDNLNGAVLFRDYSGRDAGLPDALKYIRQKPYSGRLYTISQYNLTGPDDGVTVEQDTIGALRVTFNQWGNWWWRKGVGATDYELDQFRFTNQGHSYRLEWKTIDPKAVVLYQQGEKWVEWKR